MKKNFLKSQTEHLEKLVIVVNEEAPNVILDADVSTMGWVLLF